MTSIVKTKLKTARECLGKKNYAGAKDAALQVLQFEPDNYNANVFLGLASLELEEFAESEQAYKQATGLNPDQILAWQGLAQFYERRQDWEKYAEILRRLVDMHTKSNDAVKCAEALQKYIDLRREQGNAVQLVDALYLLLPESSAYPVLSTLPAPDPSNPTATTTFHIQEAIHNSLTIIEEIVKILEREEENYVKKEFEKRRTRLNAGPPDHIRKEIGIEVWAQSRLPSLYNEVLDHPNTDDVLRRETDAKLLRYKHKFMLALPTTGDLATMKTQVVKEVEELIQGTVLLHIPDELAWTLFLERKDVENIDGYDYAHLREFMTLFPSHTLTSIFKGYFIYMQIPISDELEDDAAAIEDVDVGYDMVLEAYVSISNSLIATRIISEVYSLEADHENAIQSSEKGIQILVKFEQENGTKLSNVRLGLQAILATSLVHFYPPKHHRKATRIINEILVYSPENVAGIMAQGYIFETGGKWVEAATQFFKVLDLLGEEHDEGLRAKEEHAWCTSMAGEISKGIDALQSVLQILNESENRDHDRARCHWRLGKCFWKLDGEKITEGYQNFIAALKCDSSYAPAFTSLGIYYSEYASPPDPTRASKCFQKAFELDPREADAAHLLAKGFADEQEWDLVEVVARRTIEGEGGLDGGLVQDAEENAAAKYLPTNTWAWKALGMVNLMNRNYVPAIDALQIALRAEPEDYLTWAKLGEAYLKSGRHSAALKALGRSQELENGVGWVCSYLIAEVYRQTGLYEDAASQLKTILSSSPNELSALAALARTYLDLGCSELSSGFVARAERSFVQSIQLSVQAITSSTGFRTVIWKTAADALCQLSAQDAFCDENAVRGALSKVQNLLSKHSSRMEDILPDDQSITTQVLQATIAAYDHRIDLGSSESVAVGSAWFDFSVALRLLARRLPSSDRKTKVDALISKALVEAIRAVPVSDTYWIALGDVNFVEQPKTAQHAYIKALEIDSKNAGTWANLGLLFFHHNDLELANEAFYRAQSTDPDCTLAWFGQALIALTTGHTSGATGILEHAVGLGNIMPEADYQFASKVFSKILANTQKQAIVPDVLLPAFSVLDRYIKSRPNDPTALHLYALICESLGQIDLGVELITRAIVLLEAAYEQTEDSKIERQFTVAHSNAGRMKLSLSDYAGALESFESAMGLLPEEENDEKTLLLRVQGHLGSGIAHFKTRNIDTALGSFETALEIASDSSQVRGEVTVILSQALWAVGTEDSKEQAKSLLLECISADPENLIAINTLAAMGILTEDGSLIDAALSEILALPVDRKLQLDPERNVDRLLIQHHLGQGDAEKALGVAQGAVFADPAHHETRVQMGKLLIQMGQYGSVLPVLAGPSADNLQQSEATLKLKAVARALSSAEEGSHQMAVRLAEKNILMRPSNEDNWQILALASALSTT